jgi:coenzyme F420-reducing hydrogenase delta subunit
LPKEIGLEQDRLEMYEIAASDAPKWVGAVKDLTQKVQALGPNPLHLRRYLHRSEDKLASRVEG